MIHSVKPLEPALHVIPVEPVIGGEGEPHRQADLLELPDLTPVAPPEYRLLEKFSSTNEESKGRHYLQFIWAMVCEFGGICSIGCPVI